jgi:hypothetical protein
MSSTRRSLRGLLLVGLVALVPTLAGCPDEEAGLDDLSVRADFAVPADLAPDPCISDGGCYDCPPVAVPHFLNQCTESHCAPFDNKGRLPRLNSDGTLPPLP